jgi:hypothetical protein
MCDGSTELAGSTRRGRLDLRVVAVAGASSRQGSQMYLTG